MSRFYLAVGLYLMMHVLAALGAGVGGYFIGQRLMETAIGGIE